MLDYNYYSRQNFSYNSPYRPRYTHADSTVTPDPPRYTNPATYNYSTPQSAINNYRRKYFENSSINQDMQSMQSRYQQRQVRAESAALGIRQQEQQYGLKQQQKYQLSDYTDIDCIIEPQGLTGGLYLGNINGAKNISMLKSKGIGAVVTLLPHSGIRYNPSEIQQYLIQIDDAEDENISQYFDSAVSFIEKQLTKTNVFIHCYAGISRSASITIAYIMKRNNIDFLKAFSIVKAKRKIIEPNNGFVRQLKAYEQQSNNYNYGYAGNLRKNSYDQAYRDNIYNRFQY